MHSFNTWKQNLPGVGLALALAIPAWGLGRWLPLIGGPVCAILLGMALALWPRPDWFAPGLRFSARKLLQAAIILLGFEMNLYSVWNVGSQSLLVMFFTLSASFLAAWLAGRLLKLDGNTAILVGVGTAICGGSAIAATAPVIHAREKEVSYSISTIFLFNVAAVFLFPLAGRLLGLSDAGFGMWAGTAINDTSSVVAAGYSYSDAAGDFATIVKLTRTLMIVPVTLALAVYTARRSRAGGEFSFGRVFPWFVLGFLGASLARTLGLVSPEVGGWLAQTGKFAIVMAMAAIGLNSDLRQMARNGLRPLLLGLACWGAVALTSLLAQDLIGMW